MVLNLYAKVEDLLGIDEATTALHALYLEHLCDHNVQHVIDIGCGRGGFLELAASQGIKGYGIDLSDVMITEAKDKGLDVECLDIGEVQGSFDAAVAVFDVLNFLDDDTLTHFLEGVARILKPGGLFFADINTLHGFSNVAEGTMIVEDDRRFLGVDAMFSEDRLETCFTLFEKQEDGSYQKDEGTIVQHFHRIKTFRKINGLTLVEHRPLSLYDTDDKLFLVMKKPKA